MPRSRARQRARPAGAAELARRSRRAMISAADHPLASAVETRPICVRMPVNAKNAGKKQDDDEVADGRLERCAPARCRAGSPRRAGRRRRSRGRRSPRWRRAPSSDTSASATALRDELARRGSARESRSNSGRTTTETSRAMKPPVRHRASSRVCRAEPARRRRRTPAGTRRSRRPTAAQVSASAPSCVLRQPRSARMRASTGNAVTDIATPRNSAKWVNGTSLVEKRG